MSLYLLVITLCLSQALAAYNQGDAIQAQFQVKTSDVIYKWEQLPYLARPKFGETTTFTLGDLGTTFFYNDEFKMFDSKSSTEHFLTRQPFLVPEQPPCNALHTHSSERRPYLYRRSDNL